MTGSYSPPAPFLRSGTKAISSPGVGTEQVTSLADSATTGPNLLTGTGFNNAALWTLGVGWAGTVSVATGTATNDFLNATAANMTPVPGIYYQVRLNVVTLTAGTLTVSLGGTNFGETISAAGTYTFAILAATNAPLEILGSGFSGTIGTAFVHPSIGVLTVAPPVIALLDTTTAAALEVRPLAASANSLGLGSHALEAATSSISNVLAIGSQAAQSLTTGSGVIAIGPMAAQFATSPTGTIAIGAQALQNLLSAISNTAIGQASLLNNVTGGSNLAIGGSTGQTLRSGSNNILIGNSIDVPTAATANLLNIGNVVNGNTSTQTGFLRRTIVTTAVNYTALSTDELILVTATVTITLSPTPSGKVWIIKNQNTAAITITVSLSSGTIDGAASQTITTTNGLLEVTVDGTNGWITGKI